MIGAIRLLGALKSAITDGRKADLWRQYGAADHQGPYEVVDYTKRSPPQAAAVEPSRSNALITFAPVRQRCTSSGPSTSRWDLIPVYHRASGVSWL